MSVHTIPFQGRPINVLSRFAQGRRRAQADKANQLMLMREGMGIRETGRKSLYDVVANARSVQDPETARRILSEGVNIIPIDRKNREVLERLVSSDDATLMRGIDAIYNAVRKPSVYGAPQTLSRGGRNVLVQFDQYGHPRDVDGYAPPVAQKKRQPVKPVIVPDKDSSTGYRYVSPDGAIGREAPPPRSTEKPFQVDVKHERLIGQAVAELFDGVYDISTGTFKLRDDKDRRLALAIKNLAGRMLKDSGGKMLVTEAVAKAALRFGIEIPSAPLASPPEPAGGIPEGIEFIGFE